MHPGLVGGIIGSVVGVLGGLFGTYMSIKNAKGERAKRFMKRVSLYAWLFIVLFLYGLLMLPQPYNFLMWIPYGIALPLFIAYINRKLAQLQEDA